MSYIKNLSRGWMAAWPLRALKSGRCGVFVVALAFGVFTPALVNAGGANDFAARVDVLEFQARQLSMSLEAFSSFGDLVPPASIGGGGYQVAQSRDIGALAVRLAQVEERMRTMTGQIEGLQFQMTQFHVLIERLQEDSDFRFQQLEEALGKTDAATLTDSATLSGELPQSNENLIEDPLLAGDQPLDQPLDQPFDLGGDAALVSVDPEDMLGMRELDLNVDFSADFTQLADGALRGPGLGEVALEAPVGGVQALGQGQALDLQFDPGALITSGDADAQYQAGYNAVVQGDYVFAETQFRQFVALFPDHPQAPDATNWLGEALLQRAEYDEAAEVLFDGFRDYENSVRAPDLLLKLGVALAGAGERDTACRTFVEVQRRYPDMGGAFLSRVAEEAVQAGC